MNRVRFLLVLSVLFCFALPTFAQDFDANFGLSDADMQLFTAANMNFMSFSSADYDLVLDVYSAADDMEVQITGSGIIDITNGAFSLDIADATQAGQSMPLNLGLKVIGETIYLNIDGTSWYSITGEEITELAGSGMLPVDPEELSSGDLSSLGDVGNLGSEFGDLNPNDIIQITRNADVDGFAHFTLNVDLQTILENEEFRAAFEESNTSGMDISEFSNMVIQFDEYINLSTNTVERFAFAFEVPDQVSMALDITLSSFGNTEAIVAPADAQPFQQFLQMLMGGMGSM